MAPCQVRVQPVWPCPHPWPSSDGLRRSPNGPKSNRGTDWGTTYVHVHDSACVRVHMPEYVYRRAVRAGAATQSCPDSPVPWLTLFRGLLQDPPLAL